MYCPECGQKIPESSKFCPMCGLNLKEFYKNRFNDHVYINESKKSSNSNNLNNIYKNETKEEKAKRFEEILKNSGNKPKDSINITEEYVEDSKPIEKNYEVFENEKDNTIYTNNVSETKTYENQENIVEEVNKENKEELGEELKDNPKREDEKKYNERISNKKSFSFKDDNLDYSEEGSFKDLGIKNYAILKFLYPFFEKILKFIERPKGFYKDFFIILATIFIMITNTNVIRQSSPTQTLSFNRFLITVVASVGSLAMIVLKPYLLTTFDKFKSLEELSGSRKFSTCTVFALLNSFLRLIFYIVFNFVPGMGLILGYGIGVKGIILYLVFIVLETLILEGLLADKWKDKTNIKNFYISFIIVFVIEIITVIIFRPLITMMIGKL
ncbi:MAG: zinc ribbon domain-containing protein [Lagierella massiliensis]|nr:zinc ribbon domain-containing protein [Lagierella massiliensis]